MKIAWKRIDLMGGQSETPRWAYEAECEGRLIRFGHFTKVRITKADGRWEIRAKNDDMLCYELADTGCVTLREAKEEVEWACGYEERVLAEIER